MGSAKDVLVSVVVPAFNAEATLAETLASVAAQSHCTIEILIVDDGSRDATRDIALVFCASESRARLLSKANGGVASARNLGLAEAKGRFVALIDADDLWHPNHLSKCLAVATSTGAALVFSRYHRIDAADVIIRSGPQFSLEGMAVHRLAYVNMIGNGSALLLDRAAALAVGGYDERLRAHGAEGCEDYLLQLRFAVRGPIATVAEYLVGYRQHSRAMSCDAEQMTASNVKASELFRRAEPHVAIPDRIWRWRRAKAMLTLARYRFRRLRLFSAFMNAAQALWHDPVGTLAALHYDLRRLTRLLLRGRNLGSGYAQSFFGADPGIPLGPPSLNRPDRPTWLARIETRRMAHLTALDAAFEPEDARS
ncbi:MAG: glycosyltransferase family 2 protein [Sphingopyxis sp.]